MEIMDYIVKRESCRAYQEKPVSRDDLIKLAEAGRLSPSGCNAQPWKIVVVDDPQTKAALCDALVVEGGGTGAPWRASVPAFIVLVEEHAKVMPFVLDYYKDSQRFAQGDLGMAALNICYEAVDLGLSTCVIGMNDQKKMEAALGIPEGHEVRMVIAVGYAAEEKEPRKKMRKPFEEVVSFNRY